MGESHSSQSDKQPILNEDNKEDINIQHQGSVQIQYGITECLHDRWVIITDTHFVVKEMQNNEQKANDFSSFALSIEWTNLVNIDDLSDKKRVHSFQLLFKDKLHPSIYIYCDSKSTKQVWLRMFERFRPDSIVTKELKRLKSCVTNLGFTPVQIEKALVTYHQQYDTVYNVNVFVEIIINDNKSDEKQQQIEVDKELECSICSKVYSDPVRNIYDKTYCLHCITCWFDMIREDGDEYIDGRDIVNDRQKAIKDPLTNQKLPQNCRLLIPHFSKMAQIWNMKNNQRITDETYTRLQSVDSQLNAKRKQILNYLRKTQDSEQMAADILDKLISKNQFKCNKTNLENVINEAFDCHNYFRQIKDLIDKGTKIYNTALKRIVDCSANNHLFKWVEPEWTKYIKPGKNITNWSQVYQVEECLWSEIEQHTTTVVKSISNILLNDGKASIQQLKDQIINVLLQKQHEIMTDNDDDTNEEEKNEKTKSNKKYKTIEMERIFYKENHGLVNTECIKQIAECVKQNKAFELYHNDLNHATMTRDQMVRFLQTCGMNGIEYQHYIYECFAMSIKHELFKLASHLTKLVENGSKLEYFPYFKYLQTVNVIEQPIIEPKDWSVDNDKIELRVKFDVDYDVHLADYNGNKRELGKEIKRQMMKHLRLQNAEQYLIIDDVEKGSLSCKIIFTMPFKSLVAGGLIGVGALALIGGVYDFGCCIKQYNADPDFTVPWYRAMMQGALVGGGIGAVVAGGCLASGIIKAATTVTIAGCVTLGPIGIIAGCVIAGVVVCGFIGWGIWKYLNYRKQKQRQIVRLTFDEQLLIEPIGEKDDVCPQPAIRQQPAIRHMSDADQLQLRVSAKKSVEYQVSGEYMNDISERISNNGTGYKFILFCNHEIDYDPAQEQNEGDMVLCPDCGQMSDVSKMKRVINYDVHGGNRIAEWSIRYSRKLPNINI